MQHSLRLLSALLLGGVLLVGLTGSGCKHHNGDAETAGDDLKNADPSSLYARLGGHAAIKAVVDDFVARAAADPKVNFTRKNPGHPTQWDPTPEKIDKLKKHLVQFIAEATGGPKGAYHGESMEKVHAGMEITNAEFDAIAADLTASLESLHVKPELQKELLDVVGTTRSQIVGK